MDNAMPADTMPAPKLPSTTAMASEAGLCEAGNRSRRQYILHRGIYQHVQDPDQGDSEDQCPRNVALRIADFSRDHVQVIPAVVGPQRRHQRSHEPSHPTFRSGKAAGKVLPTAAAVTEADHHDAEDDGNFQEGEHQLKVARLLDPDVVEDRNQSSGGNCHQLSVGDRKRPEITLCAKKLRAGKFPRTRTKPVASVAMEAGLAMRNHVQA